MAFPPTRHSVIERLRDGDAGRRRAAFSDVVEAYWKPVYKHLRATWRLSPEDAQDLTQAFFSDAFEKAWLEKYEPGKARFRTFVRVCADRSVMNARQSASRQKRGGGVQRAAGAADTTLHRADGAAADPRRVLIGEPGGTDEHQRLALLGR